MTEFTRFGDPQRFEIAARWTEDVESRERRPARGGWSMGELMLTVGGHVLTSNSTNGDVVCWYLAPVAEWIADNWAEMLHEERFPWQGKPEPHAASETTRVMHNLIGRDDEQGQGDYAVAQAWRARHALRAADPGALYPDLFLRRRGDRIELSWTSRPVMHAPDGFRLLLSPGMAVLSADQVAGPLLEFLCWVVDTAEVLLAADRQQIDHLRRRIQSIEALSISDMEAAYLGETLSRRVASARQNWSLPDLSTCPERIPVLSRLDASVLMFGCVRPDLQERDVDILMDFIRQQSGGQDGSALAALVDDDAEAPHMTPHDDGYDLAERLLEDMDLPTEEALRIDVQALIERLGIRIVEQRLDESMRGVALAGEGYAPAIIVNPESPFNSPGRGVNEAGRRFTLAHELCHILYDRTRACHVAHVTGAWAPVVTEKRANAFAAMLLMSRVLVRRVLPAAQWSLRALVQPARTLGVSRGALIEHLGNIGIMDPVVRDRLRAASYN